MVSHVTVCFSWILVLLLIPRVTVAWEGKVVEIADGDTITVLQDRKQVKIRLYGIDTPEKGQAFGKAAKKYTSSLVARKTIKIIPYDTDKYERTVGVVLVDGMNVNQSLISAGLAWQYRKYCKASFCDGWLGLEKHARNSGIGLWKDKSPQPPWEWRSEKRNGGSGKSDNVVGGVGIYHGNKKSHLLHSSSCQYYNCKNCTVVFQSADDAVSAGYKAHKQCVK